MRASGWWLSAALLVGCQGAGPVGPAAERGEQRSRAGLPATLVRGVVTAPASLIGIDGGTLVGPDGGTLARLEPGMLIGIDGGTLARPGGWRLAQAGAVPLARTVVLLAGPDGTPLVSRVQTLTDASGRYALQVRGRAGLVVALALTQERRLVRLSGLLHETAAGQVAVSPASTLVSTALIAELAGTPRNFSAVRAADYQTALAGVGPAAAALTPATLTAPEALLAAAREALGASEGARKGFEAVVARLTAATYDEEAPPSLPAAAPSVAAGGRQSSAGQAQPGAPTASPVATPTAAPPPTPASAEGPPSPTPSEELIQQGR